MRSIGPLEPIAPDIGPIEWSTPVAGYGPYRAMTIAAYQWYDYKVAEALSLPTVPAASPVRPPAVNELWAHVRARHTGTELIDVGPATYRKTAVLEIRLFAPAKKGMGAVLDMVDAVIPSFRDVTVMGNIFQTPTVDQVGKFAAPNRSAWWRADVMCPVYNDDTVTLDAELSRTAGAPLSGHGDIHRVLRTRFRTEIADPYSVVVTTDNAPTEGSGRSVTAQYVNLTVRTATSFRRHAGPAGAYKVPGVAFAQIFSPIAKGEKASLILADRIAERFRSVGDRGVKFLTPALISVGRQGPWWQDNVQLPFEAQEAA